MNWHDDKQRKLDDAGMREVRRLELETRKRAALRVIDAGGTVTEAARLAKATHDTVKRWIQERTTNG